MRGCFFIKAESVVLRPHGVHKFCKAHAESLRSVFHEGGEVFEDLIFRIAQKGAVPGIEGDIRQIVEGGKNAGLVEFGDACDEVIGAMYRIGQSMSSNLKETARGGLAATPTGKAITHAIFEGGDLKSILKTRVSGN